VDIIGFKMIVILKL